MFASETVPTHLHTVRLERCYASDLSKNRDIWNSKGVKVNLYGSLRSRQTTAYQRKDSSSIGQQLATKSTSGYTGNQQSGDRLMQDQCITNEMDIQLSTTRIIGKLAKVSLSPKVILIYVMVPERLCNVQQKYHDMKSCRSNQNIHMLKKKSPRLNKWKSANSMRQL